MFLAVNTRGALVLFDLLCLSEPGFILDSSSFVYLCLGLSKMAAVSPLSTIEPFSIIFILLQYLLAINRS